MCIRDFEEDMRRVRAMELWERRYFGIETGLLRGRMRKELVIQGEYSSSTSLVFRRNCSFSTRNSKPLQNASILTPLTPRPSPTTLTAFIQSHSTTPSINQTSNTCIHSSHLLHRLPHWATHEMHPPTHQSHSPLPASISIP